MAKDTVYSKLAKRADALMRVLEEVAIDDANVVLAARKSFKLSRPQLASLEVMSPIEREGQLLELGWTEEEFQIACEARRPKSEASVALLLAADRVGMRIRKADEEKAPARVAVVVMAAPRQMTPEQRAMAKVIDVDGK